MDRNVYRSTDEPFYLDTENNGDGNKTTTSLPLESSEDGLIFHISVSAIVVLMLLTLLFNAVVITTIISCAELRKKRVNVFILNLAVGDLTLVFVTAATDTLSWVFGEGLLGNVACKFARYSQAVAVAFTVLLLTAMSVDRYQVRYQVFYTLFTM